MLASNFTTAFGIWMFLTGTLAVLEQRACEVVVKLYWVSND